MSSFSLQKKIGQLEEIEQFFAKPDFDLEQAIKKHTEALSVAKEILEYLEKAEQSIQKIDGKGLLGNQEND